MVLAVTVSYVCVLVRAYMYVKVLAATAIRAKYVYVCARARVCV